MRIAAIDPGKNGACVSICTRELTISIYRLKYRSDNFLRMGEFFHWVNEQNPGVIYLEKVTAGGGDIRRGQWQPSTLFNLGNYFGQIRTAVEMTRRPVRIIPARTWQKSMWACLGKTELKSKHATMAAYAHYYPQTPIPTRRNCKPNENVVDALILATYGVLQLQSHLPDFTKFGVVDGN